MNGSKGASVETLRKYADKEIRTTATEPDAVRREMNLSQIQDLPGFLGVLATQNCVMHGEYKCTINGVKTHIVMVCE